ncbi:MAG: hypothetical protein IPO48_00300 [Saprospiraceae bacterium]|nr:hypothetical protein [Saprospiraceae bacterium]
MKKSLFYFFPILLLVGGYFYFTIWANKTLNETIKYQQKLDNDKYGKQVKKLNINEAIEKDFYIVIDTAIQVKRFLGYSAKPTTVK